MLIFRLNWRPNGWVLKFACHEWHDIHFQRPCPHLPVSQVMPTLAEVMTLPCLIGPSFKFCFQRQFCFQRPVFFALFFCSFYCSLLGMHFWLQNSLLIDLCLSPSTLHNHQPPQFLSYTTILFRAAILVKSSSQESGGSFEFVELQQQTFNFTSSRFSGIKVSSRLRLFSVPFGVDSQSPRKRICSSADPGFGKQSLSLPLSVHRHPNFFLCALSHACLASLGIIGVSCLSADPGFWQINLSLFHCPSTCI